MAMTRVEPVELTRAKVSEEALDLMLRLSSRAAPAKAKPGKLAVARSMLAKMLREAMADVSGVVASGAAVGGSAFIVYTFLKPWL